MCKRISFMSRKYNLVQSFNGFKKKSDSNFFGLIFQTFCFSHQIMLLFWSRFWSFEMNKSKVFITLFLVFIRLKLFFEMICFWKLFYAKHKDFEEQIKIFATREKKVSQYEKKVSYLMTEYVSLKNQRANCYWQKQQSEAVFQ